MSEKDKTNDGGLVPAGRLDLAPVAAVNSLVSRGLAELAFGRFPVVSEPFLLTPMDIWTVLARTLFLKKDTDEAIRGYSEAIRAIKSNEELLRLDPNLALAFIMRGNTWQERKEYDKAIKDFDEAIRLDSTKPHFFLHRAKAMRENKEYQRAIMDFSEAIRLDPKNTSVLVVLAEFLSTCPNEKLRDSERAIQMAKAACELTDWKGGLELDTLAAAYAEAGQFDEAEHYEGKALEDLDYQGPDGDAFRQRLEIYKQQKSIRQNP